MSERRYHPIERIGVAMSSVSENQTTRWPSVAYHAHIPVPMSVKIRKIRDASLGVDMPR